MLFFCNHEEFASFFSMNGDTSYCNNVGGLMRVLGHEHKPEGFLFYFVFLYFAFR